ncbi:MAG: hypothetical protein ACW98X_12155 [Promethearchaeota archaeon]|jgi:hypothetical protein
MKPIPPNYENSQYSGLSYDTKTYVGTIISSVIVIISACLSMALLASALYTRHLQTNYYKTTAYVNYTNTEKLLDCDPVNITRHYTIPYSIFGGKQQITKTHNANFTCPITVNFTDIDGVEHKNVIINIDSIDPTKRIPNDEIKVYYDRDSPTESLKVDNQSSTIALYIIEYICWALFLVSCILFYKTIKLHGNKIFNNIMGSLASNVKLGVTTYIR